MHVGNAVAAIHRLEVELEVTDGIAHIAGTLEGRIGVRQIHRRNVAVHGSGVPHRNPDGVIVIIGRIDVEIDVIDTVAIADLAEIRCRIAARSDNLLVLPGIRQLVAADGIHRIEVIQRHRHHMDRVRTGHIQAGVSQHLVLDPSMGVTFVNAHGACAHVFDHHIHHQSGFLRNVGLVQSDELRRVARSDRGQANVRIGVRKGVLDRRGTVGVVNGNVQVHGVTVAEVLLVAAVAVQVGDGPHHRVSLHMHVGNAVAAIHRLEVELEVTDGIAHIAGTLEGRIGVRQIHRRNVAVHGSGVPHRNPDGVIVIIGRIDIEVNGVYTVGTEDGLQAVGVETRRGEEDAAPCIRHLVAADGVGFSKQVVGSHQHGIDNHAVATIDGLADLTQHITALRVEGLVEAMVGVGAQGVHRVIQRDGIHRVDRDIQINDAVQTMDRLHREDQRVSDRRIDNGTGGILDDGGGDHVLVVVLVREFIGAKHNGILHMQILRIDVHHQRVAIKHIDRMTTGQADLTVNRTVLVGRLIQLGGIVAIPLQDLISIDIGTDAVPLGNHLNRHTGDGTQTDKASVRQSVHVRGERRVAHHVVAHAIAIQTDRGGTKVTHIVDRRQRLAAVSTVVQLDSHTAHDILVLGSVHVNLEGIQRVQRTGNRSEGGRGGRHHTVNHIDDDRIGAQVGSRRVDGVTPTVDGIDHSITADTVKGEHGLQSGALQHRQRDIGHTADIEEAAGSGHLTDNAILRNLHLAVRGNAGQSDTIALDFITDGGVLIVVVTGSDVHIVHLLHGGRNCDIRIARLRRDSDNRHIGPFNHMDDQGIAGDDDGRHTLRTGVHKTNRIFTCNR